MRLDDLVRAAERAASSFDPPQAIQSSLAAVYGPFDRKLVADLAGEIKSNPERMGAYALVWPESPDPEILRRLDEGEWLLSCDGSEEARLSAQHRFLWHWTALMAQFFDSDLVDSLNCLAELTSDVSAAPPAVRRLSEDLGVSDPALFLHRSCEIALRELLGDVAERIVDCLDDAYGYSAADMVDALASSSFGIARLAPHLTPIVDWMAALAETLTRESLPDPKTISWDDDWVVSCVALRDLGEVLAGTDPRLDSIRVVAEEWWRHIESALGLDGGEDHEDEDGEEDDEEGEDLEDEQGEDREDEQREDHGDEQREDREDEEGEEHEHQEGDVLLAGTPPRAVAPRPEERRPSFSTPVVHTAAGCGTRLVLGDRPPGSDLSVAVLYLTVFSLRVLPLGRYSVHVSDKEGIVFDERLRWTPGMILHAVLVPAIIALALVWCYVGLSGSVSTPDGDRPSEVTGNPDRSAPSTEFAPRLMEEWTPKEAVDEARSAGASPREVAELERAANSLVQLRKQVSGALANEEMLRKQLLAIRNKVDPNDQAAVRRFSQAQAKLSRLERLSDNLKLKEADSEQRCEKLQDRISKRYGVRIPSVIGG